MALIDVVANLAIILTLISFLSGIPICWSIYRARSTAGVSSLPFLVGTLCCFLWLRYGLLLNDSIMISVNLTGLIFQSIYLVWVYLYTKNKSDINGKLITLIGFLAMVHFYINLSSDPSLLIGSMCSLASTLFALSPLPLVMDAIRNGSTEKLPFPMIFSSFLVTIMWFIYGHLIDDIFVQLPNGFGAIICAVELSLFRIYPAKRHVQMNPAITKEKLAESLRNLLLVGDDSEEKPDSRFMVAPMVDHTKTSLL